MLLEFRVDNHRSIKNEQVLSAQSSARLNVSEDPRPRKLDGTDDSILPVLAIYGANASGKTNVLTAFEFMIDAVVYSHRFWEPDSGVPRVPFAWDDGKNKSSTFEVDFSHEGCRYTYGFSVDDEQILEEWLFAFPHGHKRIWFTRDKDKFEFGEFLKGPNKLIEEVVGDNALYLSAASQHRHKQLAPIYSWFRSIECFNLKGQRRKPRFPRRPRLFSILANSVDDQSDEDLSFLNRFRDLLRVSDFGVVDVKHERIEEGKYHRGHFSLKHQVQDDDPWLPLEEESHGTKTMFRLGESVLLALEYGSILLVDELEASLHPLLAFELVKLFNFTDSNPRNAQLIFTTHDSNLLGTTLGEPILRRDQVYLTEKNKQGATELYPLTDYKPRKAENLERGYLQGRYGAIPFLGEYSRVGRK